MVEKCFDLFFNEEIETKTPENKSGNVLLDDYNMTIFDLVPKEIFESQNNA